MGVDYDGVGGIGIEVTDERIASMIERGVFDWGDWAADPEECLDRVGIAYSPAGNALQDDVRYYWLVEATTLLEVLLNMGHLIEVVNLNSMGLAVGVDDLEVISDMYVS